MKHDPTADMVDYCDDGAYATNRCDTSTTTKDPCARTSPLFSTSMLHYQKNIANDDSATNLPIAFEIAFDSLFVVFTSNEKKIYRISGDAYNNLSKVNFFRMNAVSSDSSNSPSRTVPNTAIETICSMDFHGLFVQVSGATKVVRLEIDIANDGVLSESNISYDGSTSNSISINAINYFELDATSEFHLLQTKGYYGRHRPCYLVTSASPT